MTKVCRLCLAKLQRGSKYFNINAVESFTGFMPYRDQLTTCIPEMALDLIPNPVICNNCRTALKSAYVFKSRCLLVEKKIRQYVEHQPTENVAYNLAEIDTSTLPKPAKYESEIQSRESSQKKPVLILPKTEIQPPPVSLLSNLLTVKKEVVLPNPLEIEITNINVIPAAVKTETDKEIPAIETSSKQFDKDEQGFVSCNDCDKKFTSIPILHTHKSSRGLLEEYICNFCNVPFKTLQNLRRHNQQCQKMRTLGTTNTVLTKRPHLPTKAKNHLRRWLFRHTDHPYPTDVEKQQLMKETNLSLLQVENWFINARRRILADLTKLKNMRGRPVPRVNTQGKRKKFQHSRIGYEYENLFDDEDEAEKLFEDDEEEEDEQKLAARVLKGLVRPVNESSIEEAEVSEENAEEVQEEEIPEDTVNVIMKHSLDEEKEENSEDDPFEDVPLSNIAAGIKMEIEVEER